MELKRLKAIRVLVSVSFFALMAFVFIDFRNILPPSVAQGVLFFQFIPSLLKFVSTAGLGAAGFGVVLLLTLLYGRVYCSTICPLGTLQDAIGCMSRKKGLRRSLKKSKPHQVLRYSLFALTIVFLMAGSGLLLNLLDPFSGFGRIFSNLVRPVVLAGNNLIAMALEQIDVHTLYRVQGAVFVPLSAGVAAAMLGLVVWLSASRGRLYCNTVCPVGTLLGFVSKFSLFQIAMDPGTCTGCGLCESACKAGCIDIGAKTLDVTRCVGCYNCFAVCRKQGVRFENRLRRHTQGRPPESGRRGFIFSLAMGIAGIAVEAGGQTKVIHSRPTTIPESVSSPVAPPGSLSIAHFSSICTACHLCVSACPSRVLVPSMAAYGLSGILQPQMNYKVGHCTYECTICTDLCPSGAILPLSMAKKKLTQLGVARFIRENCVVYTDNTNCGACSEHCPTKAVDMVPYLNAANKRLVIPKVNPDCCIGCGGCEHACPTKPYKAIYVDGNPVHKLAQKPASKKIDMKVDYKEDFPF